MNDIEKIYQYLREKENRRDSYEVQSQGYENPKVTVRIRVGQESLSEADKLSNADIEDILLPVIKFYVLRQTHATILMKNGENIKVLSERLGHKNITTTLDTYASVMQKSRTKTTDLLDGLFL